MAYVTATRELTPTHVFGWRVSAASLGVLPAWIIGWDLILE